MEVPYSIILQALQKGNQVLLYILVRKYRVMVLTTNIRGHCAQKAKKKCFIPRGFNVDLNEHALKAIDEKQRIKASITLKWCNFLRFGKLKEGKKYTPHFFRVSDVWVINTFSFKREESLLPSRNILSCYDLDGYRRLTSADSG